MTALESVPGTGLSTALIDNPSDLEPFVKAWDALSVGARRPYCAPAWQLGWWHHVASQGAELRVVVVTAQDGQLIGIAPFYVEADAWGLRRYRLLASSLSPRVTPLATPGDEERVAAEIAKALDTASPRADAVVLEVIDEFSRWPGLLSEAWPGKRRPLIIPGTRNVAPTMSVPGGDVEAWLASKSSSFRKAMRRSRRNLERMGATFALAQEPDLERAIGALARLHNLRMGPKGDSTAIVPGAVDMLAASGQALLSSDRFRLWTIATGGRVISAHLFLEAGGEVAYWLGGIDDEFAESQPGLQAIVAAIGDAIEHGNSRLDLGAGDQAYKYRFADGEDRLVSTTLVPRGAGYGPARLRRLPSDLRRFASQMRRRARRTVPARSDSPKTDATATRMSPG